MIIYEDVFTAFAKKKVDYVIVGGIAANLLGLLRATSDLDILIDIAGADLAKVDAVLRALGFKPRQPIRVKALTAEEIARLIKSKQMKALSYFRPDRISEVDIIVDSPVSFAQAKKGAKRIRVNGFRLPVISIDDLIAMKSRTGRAVDRYDVSELKKMKRMARR